MRPPVLLLCVTALLALWGCPKNEPMTPIEEVAQEAPSELLSTVNVADPRGEPQLLEGFYGLEQRAWRWTAGKFAVLLATPADFASHESSLDLRLTVPSIVIETLGPIAVTARVNGAEVGTEVYEAPGDNLLFTSVIPEGVLTVEPARVEFELDKVIPPSDQDERSLGVIAISIALK